MMKHPLITGSGILFVGSFLANIGNYIFNLLMGRMLTVSDYGLFTSFSSLFLLLVVFGGALAGVVTRYAAKFKSTDDKNGQSALITLGTKISVVVAGIILAACLLLLPVLKGFLHVQETGFVLIMIASIFVTLLLSLPMGFLQGRMQFIFLSAINVSQPIIKTITAVLLIALGQKLYGPLTGLLFAGLIPAVGLFIYLRKIKPVMSEIFDYAGFKKEFFDSYKTFFLTIIGFTLIQNTDIVMVRHYLSEQEAGLYAALSLMGKAIFYFTTPVALAFFPLIAFKKEKGEKLFGTLFLALGGVFVVSLSITAIYFLYPGFVIQIFFPGTDYQILAQYLGLFAFYIVLLSVVSLFNYYYLSIGKKGVFFLTISAGILQVMLLCLFHKNILEVIYVLTTVTVLLLLSFIGYYIKHGRD